VLSVLKFGGSILRSHEDYEKCALKVKERLSGGDVVVVVSAMRGVTDELLNMINSPKDWFMRVKELHERHMRILSNLSAGEDTKSRAFAQVSMLLDELVKIFHAVNVTLEVTPRVKDYILSFGERYSAILMRTALEAVGIDAVNLTGLEAGIITNDRFGDAVPLMEIVEGQMRKVVGRYISERIVPVITGFIGATLDGRVTTLGRGGSDYTATLVGRVMGADYVVLYTDVPGVMTGDPRYVDNVRVVPRLSYAEAMELAQLGGKKFHPRTFEPLLGSMTRVIITCPDCDGGTVVSSDESDPPIKVVSVLNDLSMITVRGVSTDGLLRIMSELSSINVDPVSALESMIQSSLSMLVKSNQAATVVRILERLKREGLVSDVKTMDGLATVGIVGHGIRDPEVLSKILRDAFTVPIYGLYRSPGENSLSMVVRSGDSVKLANIIHSRLIREWWLS